MEFRTNYLGLLNEFHFVGEINAIYDIPSLSVATFLCDTSNTSELYTRHINGGSVQIPSDINQTCYNWQRWNSYFLNEFKLLFYFPKSVL